jgi:hypothetical protein
MLAYLLDASPDIEPIRQLIGKRLLDGKQLDAAEQSLTRMLMTLWTAGYVTLDPPPAQAAADPAPPPSSGEPPPPYRPLRAERTDRLDLLLRFRGVNPLYGVYLINQLGIADLAERLQAMESVLEMPGSVARLVRVPKPDQLPPGPLATTRLDVELLRLGLATPQQLGQASDEDEDDADRRRGFFEDEPVWVLTLAEKLRLLFDHDFPSVHGVFTQPVWVAGELLEFGGDFNKYVTSHQLQKQEGVIFRHLLRLLLLIGEFRQICPPDITDEAWQAELTDLTSRLAECCRRVDPTSTDKALEEAESEGEGGDR